MAFFYTEEQLQFLKDHVKGRRYRELATLFNQKFGTSKLESTIYKKCRDLGLKNGLDSKFKKGHEPWNNGLKGIDCAGENGRKTQFKKGHVPVRKVPIGSERIDGRGRVLVKMEVDDSSGTAWKYKHLILWENKFGPIPTNHVLIALDGNYQNLDLDNYMLVHRRVHVSLNYQKLRFENAELTKAAVNMTKLKLSLLDIEKSSKEAATSNEPNLN